MPTTKFPHGVSSWGAPVLPGPGLVPSVLNGQGANNGVYFVDGTNGSDANGGGTPQTAYKTLDRAYNATFGGKNEIIFVLGGASSVNFSSSIASGGSGLVWSKSYTHLVGLGSFPASGQRAHISNGAATNLYTPLISLTGNGCVFQNVELFNGGSNATTAAVCLAITGSNNAFINCQISGGGNTTSATNAAMRSLTIAGPGGENYFQHCYIGLTTIARNTTSSEMELKGATVRNVFEGCTFASYTSSSTTNLISIGAAGIDRSVVFKDCIFLNPGTASGGSIMAQALTINANPGGVVMVHNCLSGGATVSFTKLQTTAAAAVFGDNAGSAAGAYGVAMTS